MPVGLNDQTLVSVGEHIASLQRPDWKIAWKHGFRVWWLVGGTLMARVIKPHPADPAVFVLEMELLLDEAPAVSAAQENCCRLGPGALLLNEYHAHHFLLLLTDFLQADSGTIT